MPSTVDVVAVRWRFQNRSSTGASCAAGAAPGGPEVDQHPVAAVVGDLALAAAAEHRQRPVGNRVADGDLGRALAEQAEGEQADHGADGEEGEMTERALTAREG